MELIPIKIKKILPPKDDLLAKIIQSSFKPKTGDVVCISSKVIAIHEGQCVGGGNRTTKETLAKKIADKYVELTYAQNRRALFTITQGILIRTAGIDESNGNGYFILWPKDPHDSAIFFKRAIEKHYKIKLQGVVVTDSYSVPLRRGASGFALGWAGISPIKDYRGTKDVFGRKIKITVANVVDALASAATLVMGESGASTPLCVVRGINLPKEKKNASVLDQMPVPPEDDIFSRFILSQKWKLTKKKKTI